MQDVVPLPYGEFFDRETVGKASFRPLVRRDGVAMRVVKRIAKKESDTLVLLLRELVLLAVGKTVPILGRIPRVLGQIQLIESVGTRELKGSASTTLRQLERAWLDETLPLEFALQTL